MPGLKKKIVGRYDEGEARRPAGGLRGAESSSSVKDGDVTMPNRPMGPIDNAVSSITTPEDEVPTIARFRSIVLTSTGQECSGVVDSHSTMSSRVSVGMMAESGSTSIKVSCPCIATRSVCAIARRSFIFRSPFRVDRINSKTRVANGPFRSAILGQRVLRRPPFGRRDWESESSRLRSRPLP